MNDHAHIDSAIAALEAEIKALTAQGIERGSVQSTGRTNRYRLLWRENGKNRQSKTLDPSEVPYYRAAHDRWKKVQALKRKIRKLSEYQQAAS
jgi:hypothetical protein